MSYIDTIQKVTIPVNGQPVECIAGSFKGVPFFFESAEFSGGGRNVQTNVVPFSNSHVNEDTGANVPNYSFNIYFVGEDAEGQKDRFLRVCNEKGPGELIHPYFGVFSARVTGEINLAYGDCQEYITGSISFVPENDFELKNTTVSLSGKTRQKAVDLNRAVADKTAKNIKVSGKGRSILEKAVDMSYKAVDAVYASRKSLQKSAEFVRQVGRIKSNIQTLLFAPGDYAARMQNLIMMAGEVLEIDVDPKDNVSQGVALMTFSLSVDVFDSVSLANRTSLESLVRMTGASMVSENVVDCEFASVGEAEHYQDMVHDAFETMLAETDDVDFYMQAQALEAAALKFLRDSLSRIPYEVEIELPETNNLLSLVYGTYGNLDELDAVLERNGYRDPLFVKPSDKLLVLCND